MPFQFDLSQAAKIRYAIHKSLMMFALSLFAAGFSSCKEEDHMHGDTYEANINFVTPAADQEFTSGEEVHMEINFTNDATIHNVMVRVIRDSDQAEVFLWEYHVHAETGSYMFHEHVMLTATGHEHFTIEASTWDHDSEAVPIVATRSIHVEP